MTPPQNAESTGGQTLPTELLFYVIPHLAADFAKGDFKAAATLTRIARCSTNVQKPALRALYRRVALDEDTFPVFMAENRRQLLRYTDTLVVDGLPSPQSILDLVPADPDTDTDTSRYAYESVVYYNTDGREEELYVPAPPLGRVFPNVKHVIFTERAVERFGKHSGRSTVTTFEDGEMHGTPPAHMFEEALVSLSPRHACVSFPPPKAQANSIRHRANLQPSHSPALDDVMAETSAPDWLLHLTNYWQPQSTTVHNWSLGTVVTDVDGDLLRLWPTDTACNADGEHDARLCHRLHNVQPSRAIANLFLGPNVFEEDNLALQPLYNPLKSRHRVKNIEIPAVLPSHFRFEPCSAINTWSSGFSYAVAAMTHLQKTLDIPAFEEASPCVCCDGRIVDGRGIKPNAAEADTTASPTL